MTLLAGDVGGTKTLLQIATDHTHKSPLTILYEQRYESAQFPAFEEVLAHFLAAAQTIDIPMPTAACIGVAGPIERDESGNASVDVTNLPWSLSERELSERFALRQLRLINDFQAVGYGLAALNNDELLVLQAGESSRQVTSPPRVIIGAGTGLGQGVLVWKDTANAGYYDVLDSEGGHSNFAPGNEEQVELMQFLLQEDQLTKTSGRVCVEDVLSGRGLVNVYHYFAQKCPEKVDPELTRSMLNKDPGAAVSEAALSAEDSLAARALDLFVEIYGGQAGNLALTCLAKGGVFIAGGIAPKIQSRMQAALFLDAFREKGPMTALMKKIPVTLVVNPQVGLKGALLVASRM